VDDTGARLDVNNMAIETITFTLTFGMVPASRSDIVAPALLDRVVVAANTFIKAGVALDPALLKGTTLVAVKWFYAAARKVQWLDPILKTTRLLCTNVDCEKSRENGRLRLERLAQRAARTNTSPRLQAKGEGARHRPLDCHASTCPNLDKISEDVYFCSSLKLTVRHVRAGEKLPGTIRISRF
jgi:hypothetical protein